MECTQQEASSGGNVQWYAGYQYTVMMCALQAVRLQPSISTP